MLSLETQNSHSGHIANCGVIWHRSLTRKKNNRKPVQNRLDFLLPQDQDGCLTPMSGAWAEMAGVARGRASWPSLLVGLAWASSLHGCLRGFKLLTRWLPLPRGSISRGPRWKCKASYDLSVQVFRISLLPNSTVSEASPRPAQNEGEGNLTTPLEGEEAWSHCRRVWKGEILCYHLWKPSLPYLGTQNSRTTF